MRLIETTYAPPVRIDKEAGVIYGVKLLGRNSRNGRSYSDKAISEAKALYEGQDLTLDHDRKDPNRERQVMESVGRIKDVSEKPDGLYGDFHYWKSHPAANVIVERAERDPSRFGVSHNADGREIRRQGKRVVESISRVVSLDLVLRPATVDSLFESEERRIPTIRQILESCAPDQAKACQLLEMEGMADMPVMPEEGQDVESSSSEEQIAMAFETALTAVVKDRELDMKAKLAKVKAILSAQEKLMGTSTTENQEEETKPDAAEESKAVESERLAKLEEGLTKLTESVTAIATALDKQGKVSAVKQLAETMGVAVNGALLESLLKLPDENEQRKLLESEKLVNYGGPFKQRPGAKPVVKLVESTGNSEYKPPEDGKSLVQRLKQRH